MFTFTRHAAPFSSTARICYRGAGFKAVERLKTQATIQSRSAAIRSRSAATLLSADTNRGVWRSKGEKSEHLLGIGGGSRAAFHVTKFAVSRDETTIAREDEDVIATAEEVDADGIVKKEEMDVLKSLPLEEKEKIVQHFHEYFNEYHLLYDRNSSNNHLIDENELLEEWMQRQWDTSEGATLSAEELEMKEKYVYDATMEEIKNALAAHAVQARANASCDTASNPPKMDPFSDVDLTDDVKMKLRILNPVTYGLPSQINAVAAKSAAKVTEREGDTELERNVETKLESHNFAEVTKREGDTERNIKTKLESRDFAEVTKKEGDTELERNVETKLESRDFAEVTKREGDTELEQNVETKLECRDFAGLSDSNINSDQKNIKHDDNNNDKNNDDGATCDRVQKDVTANNGLNDDNNNNKTNSNNLNTNSNNNDDSAADDHVQGNVTINEEFNLSKNSSKVNVEFAEFAETTTTLLLELRKAVETTTAAASRMEALVAETRLEPGRGRGIEGEERAGGGDVEGEWKEKLKEERAKTNHNESANLAEEATDEACDESSISSGCDVFDAFERNLREKRSMTEGMTSDDSTEAVTITANQSLRDNYQEFVEDNKGTLCSKHLAQFTHRNPWAPLPQSSPPLSGDGKEVKWSSAPSATPATPTLTPASSDTEERENENDLLLSTLESVLLRHIELNGGAIGFEADVSGESTIVSGADDSGVYRGRSVKSGEFGIQDLELQIQAMRNEINQKNNVP